MIEADVVNVGAAALGGGGALWVVRWLILRAVATVDTALLRFEARVDRVERTLAHHGETLAVIAHELGVRNRKGTTT